MNLSDIIALAKQGYKPGDIKELIDMAKPEPVETPEPVEAPKVIEKEEPQAEEPKAAEPDYKKMYEESQAALKKAQEANRRQPAPEPVKVNEEEQLADIVRSFM